MKDIFDRIAPRDIFDEIELPVEEKVIFSEEMQSLIRKELKGLVAALPVGQMITKVLEQEAEKQKKSEKELTDKIYWLKTECMDGMAKIKTSLEELKEKVRKNHDNLKTEIRQPRYEFGGFSPQTNDLNIGPPEVEGAWRMVKSGDDLVFQRYESGVWTLKGSFTP